MAEDKKPMHSSEKTAGLKKTLSELNIKNMQAMKLLDEKYAVKNQVGTTKRQQAGAYAERRLAQLGSASSIKMPEGYQRPRN